MVFVGFFCVPVDVQKISFHFALAQWLNRAGAGNKASSGQMTHLHENPELILTGNRCLNRAAQSGQASYMEGRKTDICEGNSKARGAIGSRQIG